MKSLILLFTLMSGGLIFLTTLTVHYMHRCEQMQPRIIKQVTDDRNLTSIIFVQRSDTMALDYLTPQELKFFNH
jgi:hypothetical protein